MIFIKYIILISILFLATYIGILLSKKYSNRVKDLKDMKIALNIFKTKTKLTYEPLPNVFKDISTKVNLNISNIFKNASTYMDNTNAGNAWNKALDESNTNMNKEDIEVLKGLSNLLGRVDIEGQIRDIELVENFLDKQIEEAQIEKAKNEKLYKTLGITFGLAIAIILI